MGLKPSCLKGKSLGCPLHLSASRSSLHSGEERSRAGAKVTGLVPGGFPSLEPFPAPSKCWSSCSSELVAGESISVVLGCR